jgi:hypothetical protein
VTEVPSPGDANRRTQARRSTAAGLGGIALVVIAVVLTLAHVAGNVVPTVLAIVGVGSLLAAVATGVADVIDGFKLSRRQSDDD